MVLLKLIEDTIRPEDSKPSTFHYGSIKISHANLIPIREFSSTFHYGSIKINISSIFLYNKISIYIPLWFY